MLVENKSLGCRMSGVSAGNDVVSRSRMRFARRVVKKAVSKAICQKVVLSALLSMLSCCMLTGRSFEARDAVADCESLGATTSLWRQRCEGSKVNRRFNRQERRRGKGKSRVRRWRR